MSCTAAPVVQRVETEDRGVIYHTLIPVDALRITVDPTLGRSHEGEGGDDSISKSNSDLYPPRVQHLIDNAWDTALKQDGIVLFDGPMLATRDIWWDASTATLNASTWWSSYKPYYGLNVINPDKPEVQDYLVNPMGITAVCLTSDECVVLGKRAANLADNPSCWHVPGGNIDKDHINDGVVDPWLAMRSEVEEEVGISPADLKRSRYLCVGIERKPVHLKPEFVFIIDLPLSSTEVMHCYQQAADKAEHTEMKCVSITDLPDCIQNWSWTPTGALIVQHYLDARADIHRALDTFFPPPTVQRDNDARNDNTNEHT